MSVQTEQQIINIKEFYPDLIQPRSDNFNDKNQGGHKTIVIGKPGCFEIGTKILMFDGSSKNVEDVEVGDKIMGWDSTERTVLELCRNRDKMFEIVPKKGKSYVVNLKHKLVLKCRYTNNIYTKGEIIEISVEDFLKKSLNWQKKWFIFKNSVEFSEKKIENPYNMGFKFESILPKDYIINSRKNRLEFLAGILDNLGIYDIKTNTFDIMINKEKYADDLVFLATSLGFISYKKPCNYLSPNTTDEIILIYKVFINGDFSIVPSRVRIFPKTQKDRDFLSYTFKIVPRGEGDYYGFTIDGDHRFLLYSFDVVRNTGKSTLIASLLYSKKHIFPVGKVMSGTEDSNHFYKTIFPSTFVFNKYEEEEVSKFIKRQKIAKEHLQNPWAILILDDCTDEPAIFRTPLQQGMYKRGRHWKMWYIVSLQYAMDVRPYVRTNTDGIFILREPNLKIRHILYENYAGIIPDFNLFCEILDQITDDYTALYIDNSSHTNDWKDCIYWYKAPKDLPKDFRMGCDEFWDFHEKRYNPEYVEPIEI